MIMYRLPLILALVCGCLSLFAQSPHGDELQVNCAECHNSAGWAIDYGTVQFDHDETSFALEGTHAQTDCKLCHSSLVFSEAPLQCIDCHTDIHNMSVGNDCARCHDSQSWLVDEIPELHEENGFALIGAHASLSCVECHVSETNLRFERLGNECLNCHREEYDNTQNPNHLAAGYSLQCSDCHTPLGQGWNADGISHDFFPLTQGHDIQDCARCHTTGNYSDANPECVSCHLADYNQANNPNHQTSNFSTDCATCHSTSPGWSPATFDHDDQYFPIYSGKHRGEWNACVDCHTDPNNYADFTCFTCHKSSSTNDDHRGVSGYTYESNACLRCHPDGSE